MPNDILIFMSDGYLQEPEMILEKVLKDNFNLPSEKIVDILDRELSKYQEVTDDKTLIIIKIQTLKEFKKAEEKQKTLQNI